ncbi:hypothetical protein HK101_006084 [Irineochytrium annulatum]|nr:hypothetical protein HK101_006084 [Irineochytrium annulatum]
MSSPDSSLAHRPAFLREKHIQFVKELDTKKDELEYWMSEHLRVNGVYWGLQALWMMKAEETLDREEVIRYLLSCQDEDGETFGAAWSLTYAQGSFGGHVDHDGHIIYTLSAIQVLAMYDALDRIDTDKVVAFVKSLQKADGSFMGDKWGQVDTRFSYCCLSCLSILGHIDAVDVPAAVDYVMRCSNFDGGFGTVPGAESHAAYIFCCVGALAIANALHRVDAEKLGWWLALRQLPEGGLNGRPEKLPDVCYSWWVLSSLSIINRVHWIEKDKLIAYILKCQDDVDGGIADRPEDKADVFHTVFGIAGLSLLGYPGLDDVDPRDTVAISSKADTGGMLLPSGAFAELKLVPSQWAVFIHRTPDAIGLQETADDGVRAGDRKDSLDGAGADRVEATSHFGRTWPHADGSGEYVPDSYITAPASIADLKKLGDKRWCVRAVPSRPTIATRVVLRATVFGSDVDQRDELGFVFRKGRKELQEEAVRCTLTSLLVRQGCVVSGRGPGPPSCLRLLVVETVPADIEVLVGPSTELELEDELEDDALMWADVSGVNAANAATIVTAAPPGLETAFQSLLDMILTPLVHSQAVEELRVDCPKGTVMRLVVRTTRRRLLTINGPEVFGAYLGESEEKLRDKFNEAREIAAKTACVLFIDEMLNHSWISPQDALTPNRTKSSQHESRVVATLLTLMDGLASRGRLVVVGATNRPNAIDPALRRPGRFDREIPIDYPTESTRLNILRALTASLTLADDVDLASVAANTNGCVGADLVHLCRATALAAAARSMGGGDGMPPLTNSDFEHALRISGGAAVTRGPWFTSLPAPPSGAHTFGARDWDDVGGLDDVKRALRVAFEWPLAHVDALTRLGVEPARGVLLFGPPGCSKTTLVRVMAGRGGWTFLSVRGSEIFSSYVGDSERAGGTVFQRARASAPSIVFFDEVDAIVGKRGLEGEGSGGASDPVRDRVLSSLLNEMDGIEAAKNVLVVGATNRPDRLDAALLRPGRFDRVIYKFAVKVPPPDEPSRLAILRVHTRGLPLHEDVSLEYLARDSTERFTGADLESLCREAAMAALRETTDAGVVMARHFRTALASIVPTLSAEMIYQYEDLARRVYKADYTDADDALEESALRIALLKKERKHKSYSDIGVSPFANTLGPLSLIVSHQHYPTLQSTVAMLKAGPTSVPILKPALVTPPTPPALTPDQGTMLTSLRQLVDDPEFLTSIPGEPLGDERAWLNDACLLRYLRATKWASAPVARDRVAATVKWRREYRPTEITAEEVEPEGASGKHFFTGFDRQNRPLYWLVPREKGISLMPEGVEQFGLMIDFEGQSMMNSTPISVSKQFLDIVSNHYPERLGIGIMINPTWYLWVFFKLLGPFLDPVTKSKIHFFNSKVQKQINDGNSEGSAGWTNIADHIDLDQVPVEYGGTFEFVWDHETYWRHLTAAVVV